MSDLRPTNRRLNLGCGVYHEDGADWINIDANPHADPDILRDVRRGLPFDGSSCAEVLTSHFLEHLPPDDLIFLIGEIHRVLVASGIWRIVVPLGNTGDIDHKMQFSVDSFAMLPRPEAERYYQIPGLRFEEVSKAVKVEPTRPLVESLWLMLRAVK